MERERKTTVLVVDDEDAILDLMRDFLEAEGFQVETARLCQEARAILTRTRVDCLLLDVMLPGTSGFEFCRELRQQHNIPLLFLSARGSDNDKLRGFGLGGDDYIVKSATPAEVVARIKAVLRRSRPAAREAPNSILHFGRLSIDLAAHEVFVEGKPVPLPAKEFALLCLLAEHPRQVFTRDQLFEQIWGEFGERHTVAVHIGRIREKIESDPAHPRYITTVWGVGYRFEEYPQ